MTGPSALIRFLASFCREHPRDEKVLLCPSFIIGRQIGETLARHAGSWINLRIVTPMSLAVEMAAPELVRRSVRLLSESELLVLLDRLFRSLQQTRDLRYLDRLEPSPGVVRAVLRAITTLRLEGVDAGGIAPGMFCVPEKGRDIALLLRRYKSLLASAKAIDTAGLFEVALEAVEGVGSDKDERPTFFLLPSWMTLSKLERELLLKAAGGRLVVIPHDPVVGLEPPRRFGKPSADVSPPSNVASNIERLPWLFAPGEGPDPKKDGSLDLFRAVGPMNECREILRRILAARIPFDEVEIIVPPGPDYLTVLDRLSRRAGIPITFADGLPLALTSAGRALQGLIEWIEGNYQASLLGRLIEAGDLRLRFPGPEDPPPPHSVSRHLRLAMIGWGRDRYLERLEAWRQSRIAELRAPRHGDDDEVTASRRRDNERSVTELDLLIPAVRDFLDLVPDVPAPRPVALDVLARGLAEAVEACAGRPDDPSGREEAARNMLVAHLKALAEASSGGTLGSVGPESEPLSLETALDRIRTAFSSLSVGASAPKPGRIHVSSFDSGGFSGRSTTFLAGLVDSDFPGHGQEDPLLLDAERAALSPGLPTSADILRERLFSLAARLASLRGKLVASFPSYDILEERASFPSSLVLQLHRLRSGDERQDFDGLDKALAEDADPAGFVPSTHEDAVDEMEWWLARLVRPDRAVEGRAAVLKVFPDLKEGQAAEEARAGPKLTAYEGLVRPDPERFDPLTNPRVEVSATRLEGLVKCPFSYFLRNVLEVEPPEEIELDPARWLDPMDRGSLIHEILFRFMSRVTKAGERVEAARHGPLLERIAAEVLESWKQEIPPPSEGVFERERADILEGLRVFLRIESGWPENIQPLAFEKSFRSVPIGVRRNQSFRLKGRIDRIDRTGPETFRVLDYKTGSPKAYEDLVQFGRGRILQHALYALAAEKLLAKEGVAEHPRVTESGYLFPTRKGEGSDFIVPAFDRKALAGLLDDILALIRKGFFATTINDEDCRYCDYASVCDGQPDRTKSKIKSDPGLVELAELLARVRAHE